MSKFCLEFILYTYNNSEEAIRNYLAEFGECLTVALCRDNNTGGGDFKININTDEPTAIFDVCSQLGRIKTIKVDEVK